MKTVTADYAAAHLEGLLDAAEAGESIVIERDGTRRVRLVPASEGDGDEDDVPSREVEEAFYGD